jgi:hypothetical protein
MDFQYQDTREYRALFRKITSSSSSKTNNPFDIDDETLDENDYDEQNVSAFLDTIYERTHRHPLFQLLYDKAAAKMISENREIGLTVLLSYDYLSAFYPCYCEYNDNPDTFHTTNTWYITLTKLLS